MRQFVPRGFMSVADAVCIRPISAADIDAVLELELASESAPHWGRALYADCLESDTGSALRRFVLVAEMRGAVAGFAMLRVVSVAEIG